jgi:hypothetical protein
MWQGRRRKPSASTQGEYQRDGEVDPTDFQVGHTFFGPKLSSKTHFERVRKFFALRAFFCKFLSQFSRFFDFLHEACAIYMQFSCRGD